MRNEVCAGVLATMVGGYVLRRQGLRWGATDEEVLLYYMFVERQHFVMVRRMLLGFKERAERAQSAHMAARS